MESQVIKLIGGNFKFTCTLTRLGGKSGNPVYMIVNNHVPYAMIKVFTNERSRQYEIDAYKFLDKHKFHTVKVMGFYNDSPYFYLITEIARGKSVTDAIKESSYDIEKLCDIGAKLGLLLRQIHSIQCVDVRECVSKNEFLEIVRFGKTKMLCDKEAFWSNPGHFTYIHGDPNPDNFFIDEDLNIIIIDPGQLMKSTYKNMPRGFPAGDYERFIFGFTLQAKIDKIAHIDKLLDAFMKHYGDTTQVFTKEAADFFRSYWTYTMKRKISHL